MDYFGWVDFNYVDYIYGARPAFNLNLPSVLFVSAAEGAGVYKIPSGSKTDWKLTLKDSDRSEFASTAASLSATPGGKISIPFTGAATGTKEYVSILVCDSTGKTALYYGGYKNSAASGTADFVLPSTLPTGNYTVKLFSEQRNGQHESDYASDFVSIPLTVAASVSYEVTFKVANGYWNTGDNDSADRKVTLTGPEGTLKLASGDIPAAGEKPIDNTYKEGSWNVTPSAETTITGNTTYTYTYAKKNSISATVIFKAVNGGWNDETLTGDQTVTLTGYEGDTLKLAAGNIPAVGGKPADTYKKGAWDVLPSIETAITEATTYTYTYAAKDSISQTVTFQVVNGSWDNGNSADITVTLAGHEGDTLKLAENQIPAVGTKPADTYKTGNWDVTPSTDTAITEATAYTYTYAKKDSISVTVTLKVVHGAWGDGTREDKTVVLTGYEGDELRLTIDDIPQVTKPDEGYEFGSGEWTPDEPPISFQGIDMGDPITEDTTFTFTYGVKTAVSHTLTVSYVYEDQTQAAETHTESLTEGVEYAVASPVIDGFTPDQDTVSGTMGTEDVAVTVTYHAAQVIPVECGHEAEEIPAVPPTCTKKGSTAGEKCKLCGVILRKPEPVPALGHDYREKRTIVEIAQEGIAGFVCSRCGDTIISYFLMGDVNGDGVVDGRDLLRLARFLAGQDVEIVWQAAEMTGDGEVDGRDLLRLAKYVAGVI